MDEAELRNELRMKLMEETNEYLAAESDREAVEELADIMELLHALTEMHGATTVGQLVQIRAEKAKQRGGFKSRVYLIEVEDA